MRPQPNATKVEIPLTLDVSSQYRELDKKRMTIGAGIILLAILCAIGGIILFGGGVQVITVMCLIAAAVITCVRLLYFNEKYYAKKYGELKDNDFVYDNTLMWQIYEIAPNFPICSFKNGSKCVFVKFDKDIVIGKSDNSQYEHYEAIADAYQTLVAKGIECMHIDYMDTVGKDGRLEPVVAELLKTPNAELKQLLSVIFEYQQYCMSHSYTTYDVYAFYYRYEDSAFKDDLENILANFMQANYKRYRLLGVSELRELFKSVGNLQEFSVNKACDGVFKDSMNKDYLRVIWTEKDGERTILNKTQEEQQREKDANRKSKPPIIPVRETAATAPNIPVTAPITEYAVDSYEDDGDYVFDDDIEIKIDDFSVVSNNISAEKSSVSPQKPSVRRFDNVGSVTSPVNEKAVTGRSGGSLVSPVTNTAEMVNTGKTEKMYDGAKRIIPSFDEFGVLPTEPADEAEIAIDFDDEIELDFTDTDSSNATPQATPMTDIDLGDWGLVDTVSDETSTTSNTEAMTLDFDDDEEIDLDFGDDEEIDLFADN